MNPDICVLISLTDGEQLIRVALKTPRSRFPEFYMVPKGKEAIRKMLPIHVRSFGMIVHVEEIFEVI